MVTVVLVCFFVFYLGITLLIFQKGKSCLTIQFCKNEFISTYDPTIENVYRKQLSVAGRVVVAEILDTAGQDEYKAILENYIRNGEGFIVVYSVDNRTSFESAADYYETITRVQDKEKFPCILAANKCDLQDRDIKTSEGTLLASRLGCKYLETSAKNAALTEQLFKAAIEEVLAEYDFKQIDKPKKKLCTIL